MYYTNSIKITTNNVLAWLYRFISMGVYIPWLYSLRKKKKKKTHFTSVVSFIHFGESQLFHLGILNIQRFLIFFLTYNTLIVQINNTICRIFIPSSPFFTFFYFHIFLGNLSLINNHINNICDLRSPPYNKLVHGDKNDNVILSLKRIS